MSRSVRLGGHAWPGYAPWAETVLACRRELTRVARSFWLIPEFVPLPQRDDIALLYCVCRRLDDAIDEAPDPAHARAALAAWRAELRGSAEPRPAVAAFLAGAARARLPMECLDHLLDGLEQDLGPVRVADDDALVRYAYRVASAVGLLLAPLLGIRGAAASARVVDLGIAVQISNILFGVAGDARRGRVYLPATRLATARLDAEHVLRAPADAALLPVLQGLARLADSYYRSVLRGASCFPLRYRHGLILFARAYADLGWRAARGERSLDVAARIPLAIKALRLAELVATAWHPRTMGVLPLPPHDATLHRAIAGLPGTAAWLASGSGRATSLACPEPSTSRR